MTGCSKKSLDNLGVVEGKLADCPSKPNCVSSMANDSSQFVEPIDYEGDSKAAMRVLEKIIGDMPGAKVVQRKPRYLRVEYRSSFFGFIDDVEFYLPEGENAVHVRSASRIGYYDFGVNKKRVNHIRDIWDKQANVADRGY